MNYDWIKTRAFYDEEKIAMIDPLKTLSGLIMI